MFHCVIQSVVSSKRKLYYNKQLRTIPIFIHFSISRNSNISIPDIKKNNEDGDIIDSNNNNNNNKNNKQQQIKRILRSSLEVLIEIRNSIIDRIETLLAFRLFESNRRRLNFYFRKISKKIRTVNQHIFLEGYVQYRFF